jgi:STE24 endopeptidase
MGRVIAGGVKHKLLSLPVKLTLGFFTLGVFLAGYFTGFGWYTVLMLSPWAAPLVVPWLSRMAEHYADRVAADLGFGVPLAEVFAGRELERARSAWRPERWRGPGGMTSVRYRSFLETGSVPANTRT